MSATPNSFRACRCGSSGRCRPDRPPATASRGAGALRPVVLVPHVLALGLYALAAALALAPFAGLRPAPRAVGLGVPLLGIAAHVIGVARLPSFLGVAPTLSMLALFLVALQAASEGLFRASAVGVFTGPLATGLLGLAFGVRYAGGASVDAAQVVWGMLTWVVLGWAVGVRVVRHWAGRRAAFASIASFTAVLLVYVAFKLAGPGTQSFLLLEPP